MFGLTFEKLILIAVIAAFIIGPAKLPLYAAKLGQFVQQLRGYAQTAKERVKDEMGPDFDDVEWKKLDPRQYDPRRIIRDALLDDSTPAALKSASTPVDADRAAEASGSVGQPTADATADRSEDAAASVAPTVAHLTEETFQAVRRE